MQVTNTIDERIIREHVDKRLSAVRASDDPVPHVIVDDFFPSDFYRELSEAWPPLDAFKRDKTGQKYDLVPGSAAIDSRSAGYERLAPDARTLWDFFVSRVNRRIVAPQLVRLFQR